MSGNASLAAARRRRGMIPEARHISSSKPTFEATSEITNQSNFENTMILDYSQRQPTTPFNLLKEHDRKLFDLEKKMILNETSSNSIVSDELMQMKNDLVQMRTDIVSVKKNIGEFEKIKKEVAEFQISKNILSKSFPEMTTTITTLRATVQQQEKDIAELKRANEERINANIRDDYEQSDGSEPESDAVAPDDLSSDKKKGRQFKGKTNMKNTTDKSNMKNKVILGDLENPQIM